MINSTRHFFICLEVLSCNECRENIKVEIRLIGIILSLPRDKSDSKSKQVKKLNSMFMCEKITLQYSSPHDSECDTVLQFDNN